MECEDKGKKQSEMVASLQARRKVLEAKIREKNDALKVLCIQEAELTGVLPPETPLEPGESPPAFRRRMGTAFVYPENLINKLKSKEEEALANLELECKIQTSIAEAALGLANDGTVSKAVRRKHRLMYQQSQRRLHELETKLNHFRQNSRTHLKQRKKPRPPLESENDCIDGSVGSGSLEKTEPKSQPYHPMLSYTVSDKGPIRHSLPVHNYNILPDTSSYHRQLETNYSYTPSWQQHYSKEHQDMDKIIMNHHGSQINRDQIESWCGDVVKNINHHPRLVRQNVGNINEVDRDAQFRFGSLDRRRLSMGGHQMVNNCEDFDRLHHSRSNHVINTLPHPSQTFQSSSSQINSVLLPNQTYPENSLMRTQSLGSVELTKCDPDTRSLKSNPHHSCYDSLKPDSSIRHSKLDAQNHNFIDAHKYQSDSTLKMEPRINQGKFEIESRMNQMDSEFQKTSNSQESLKLDHPSYLNKPHHHSQHLDIVKYDLKTVIEGSPLNMYSQSHHDLNYDIQSLTIDPKGEYREPVKPDSSVQRHETNTNSLDVRKYYPRFPEPSKLVKYPPKPAMRPPHYHEERRSSETLHMVSADPIHNVKTVSSETINELVPKKYDSVPAELPEVANRKTRDKEWYETSLDSRQTHEASQTPPLPPQFSSPPPPPLPPPPRSATPNCSPQVTSQPAAPVEFDTVVPFESPKNHTVVQAGKWQPYREVTKPFEMADFYKYSTKFRNKNASSSNPTPTNEPSVSQSSSQLSSPQKGTYKPVKPVVNQPPNNTPSRSSDVKNVSDIESPSGVSNSSQLESPPSLANAFSTEMLAWYQDQSTSQTRSATLV